MTRQNKPVSSETPKTAPVHSKVVLATELVRALTIPVLFFVALAIFWGPIQKIAQWLPGYLEQSESISISSLSIKVSKRLKSKVTPEVANALSKMSPRAIRDLISMNAQVHTVSDPQRNGAYSELLAIGLIKELSADDLKAVNPSLEKFAKVPYLVAFQRTKLGDDTVSFVLAATQELIQELDTQGRGQKADVK